MTQSRDSRSAVDKAFDLLRAFGSDSAIGVGVTELARRTDLSKSTAFRVLAMLEANGAVDRAGTQYRLGPLASELTAAIPRDEHDRVRDSLTPFLAHLFERTRQTVHLATLEGTDVVYLNKLHGLQQVPSPSRIGARVPAYCTAVGKALLAFNPEVLDDALAGELTPWTPHTITDPAKLREQIQEIREMGVAFDHEEIMPGLNCIAAVVTSPTGVGVAAMSVSGPVGRFDPRSAAAGVRAVCADAGRAYAARLRAERRSS